MSIYRTQACMYRTVPHVNYCFSIISNMGFVKSDTFAAYGMDVVEQCMFDIFDEDFLRDWSKFRIGLAMYLD